MVARDRIELSTLRFSVQKNGSTRGNRTPLPVILLAFCQTPDHSKPPRAATDCQSFVSRLSLVGFRSRKSGTSRLDDHESTINPIAEFSYDFDDHSRERAPRVRRKTNQNHAIRLLPTRIREHAEILVFGQQRTCFGARKPKNYFVRSARIDFGDGRDVVTGSSESSYDSEVTAFIGEKLHRLVWSVAVAFADEDDLFVRERVSRIAHRSVYVVARELRVSIEQIGLSGILAQFAQDELDRNPRSANNGFPQHHSGIHVDAIGERHEKLSQQDTSRTTASLAASAVPHF